MPDSDRKSRPRARAVAPAGSLLREWRSSRRLSQLALALEADVSARHLSCVETGKAQASRDMLARLADVLGMPLRERNALLVAAGYAPEYPESALGVPELAAVRRAVEFILAHQEPYPAFVLNPRWDILQANRAAERVAGFLCGGSAHANMLQQFFDPGDLRAFVVNWDEVARDLLRHLHDVVTAVPGDQAARNLLDEVLRYPGVPSKWRTRDLDTPPPPVLTVEFRKGDRSLRFFSTIATFGTARDITVDELRIECTFPADEGTAEFCRELASDDRQSAAR